jgi:hypothetical protein
MINKFRLALPFVLASVIVSVQIEPKVVAKNKTLKPDLSQIVSGKGWTVVNRHVSLVADNGRHGVHFDEAPNVGVAWLDHYQFQNGTIEFDFKGRNVLQKSFVGIAFQATDDTHWDAIYFRPFNFRSDDPERRKHAVQYIGSPDNDWKELRAESPGKYEQPIEPAPDPEKWLHARIVVDDLRISVYVEQAKTANLVVDKLNPSLAGKIGLWVGDASDGSFADLKITPAYPRK